MKQAEHVRSESIRGSAISRRNLLKSTAALTAGVALAGVSSGCGSKAPTDQKNSGPVFHRRKVQLKSPGRAVFFGPDSGAVTQQNVDDPNHPFNGILDAKKMAADGVAFNGIRIGKPNEPIDKYAARSRADTYEQGILPLLYSVMISSREMAIAKQAQLLTDMIVDTDPSGNRDPKKVVGMLALDVEAISIRRTPGADKDFINPTFADACNMVNALKKAFGEQRRMLMYTNPTYWLSTNGTSDNIRLGNPGKVPGTELWLAQYMEHDPQDETTGNLQPDGHGSLTGPIQELLPLIARPGGDKDPYQKHRFAGYPDYMLRQFTNSAHYQQFQGQEIHTDYVGKHPAVIDFNVAYTDWSNLCDLARAPIGDYPQPDPFKVLA